MIRTHELKFSFTSLTSKPNWCYKNNAKTVSVHKDKELLFMFDWNWLKLRRILLLKNFYTGIYMMLPILSMG